MQYINEYVFLQLCFIVYRFYLFSREEERIHIHVIHADGEAKIWLEPEVELHSSYGLSSKQEKEIIEKVKERRDEIQKFAILQYAFYLPFS